ncbi:MAG: adenylate/guanylate cyclase domain-containing protein [Fimbriimonadaceae bacterium]
MIRHLGSHPEDRDAQGLAERFGLEPGVVELALQRAPSPTKPAKAAIPKPATSSGIENLWKLCIERPGRSVLFSALAALALYSSMILARPIMNTPVIVAIAVFSILFLSFLLHAALVYQLRSVKWAILCAFAIPMPLGLSIVISGRDFASLGAAAALIATLGVIGAAILVPVTTLSGYIGVRVDEKKKRSRTRQELILRLLDIRDRLETGGSETQERAPTLLDRVRERQWIVLPAACVVVRLVGVLLLIAVDPDRLLMSAQRNPDASLAPGLLTISLAAMGVQALYSSLVFLAGYVVRNFGNALAFALLFELIGYAMLFGPIRYGRPEDVLGPNVVSVFVAVALTCGVAVAGAMAGKIQEHLRNTKLERANDRETLTAEMIEIEWHLRPQTRQVFVVVADVAGSTAMKDEADPLAAEATFREYQNLVSGIATNHNGKVHATAGDGTVLGFDDPTDALSFSQSLHKAMPQFNAESNRLGREFQLRIGIHSGEVVGDLSEVQFTRVIDVAAHVEAAATVGGTAISDEVALALPEGTCLAIGSSVEGHELFVPVQAPEGATLPSAQASN